ncbi:unnamed protein product, partial [Owenia fusiformis]
IYKCHEGYALPLSQFASSSMRVCQADGIWSGTIPYCEVMVKPKVLECPTNITHQSKDFYAIVTLPKPLFLDRLGLPLTYDCGRYRDANATLSIGEHVISCRAVEPELLTIAYCTFTV